MGRIVQRVDCGAGDASNPGNPGDRHSARFDVCEYVHAPKLTAQKSNVNLPHV